MPSHPPLQPALLLVVFLGVHDRAVHVQIENMDVADACGDVVALVESW